MQIAFMVLSQRCFQRLTGLIHGTFSSSFHASAFSCLYNKSNISSPTFCEKKDKKKPSETSKVIFTVANTFQPLVYEEDCRESCSRKANGGVITSILYPQYNACFSKHFSQRQQFLKNNFGFLYDNKDRILWSATWTTNKNKY